MDNGGRHRQSGKSKSFDVFQNCSEFTEILGEEENEGQVDILQNIKFVFIRSFWKLQHWLFIQNLLQLKISENCQILLIRNFLQITNSFIDPDFSQIDVQDCKEYN